MRVSSAVDSVEKKRRSAQRRGGLVLPALAHVLAATHPQALELIDEAGEVLALLSQEAEAVIRGVGQGVPHGAALAVVQEAELTVMCGSLDGEIAVGVGEHGIQDSVDVGAPPGDRSASPPSRCSR